MAPGFSTPATWGVMTHLLRITIASLAIANQALAAQSLPMCRGVERPRLGGANHTGLFRRVSSAALDSVMPGLMTIWVDGDDSAANAVALGWERRFTDLASREPEHFRWLLVYAIDRGIAGEAVPLLAVNEAAVWYRRTWGRADPLLPFMQYVPSDRLLLPLSALNQPLATAEEEFVFSVTCDVAEGLRALQTAPLSPQLMSESRLAWPYAAERILRHAERLIRGARKTQLQALLSAVPLRTPPLDPKSFAADAQGR